MVDFMIIVGLFWMHRLLNLFEFLCHFFIFFVEEVLFGCFGKVFNDLLISILIFPSLPVWALLWIIDQCPHEIPLVDEGDKMVSLGLFQVLLAK